MKTNAFVQKITVRAYEFDVFIQEFKVLLRENAKELCSRWLFEPHYDRKKGSNLSHIPRPREESQKMEAMGKCRWERLNICLH